jgi:prevent-host-death family protein
MIGVRELRTDLAAHVRRAANGEPTIVSINGHPAAVLAPLAMSDEGSPATQLSSLVNSGAVVAPRRGDGRATLSAMLREYVISEAMHALGIPTTRSLAVAETGEEVWRQDGAQPGGVLTRVAAASSWPSAPS